MKKIICLLTATVIMLCLCACGDTKTQSDKLSIVAVSFPEYDFARAVAKDEADIKMLIPPGGEVHGYEPTVSDIKAVTNCDVFICTGGESDSWVNNMLSSVNNPEIEIIAMAECVDTICTDEHEHEHSHDKYTVDEHVWTSTENAEIIVNTINSTLCKIDSANKSTYETNAAEYCESLEELSKNIKAITENRQHNTLVFGDRFPLAYFAQQFELEYLSAFSGCSEDTEASAQVVANLIDYVKENNIKVVFVNELSNTSIADQIATETGAEVKTFYSCHKISKDDFESGKTYIDIMSRNIENLDIALK